MKLLESSFKDGYGFIIIEEDLYGDLLYLFIDNKIGYNYWENLYNSEIIKPSLLIVDEFFDYMARVDDAEQKS